MFALNKTENTSEVLNFESKIRSDDLIKDLIKIHGKLKHIARLESKKKFSIAKLDQQELEKIKMIEDSLGYCLIAYQSDTEISKNKNMILEQVDSLLDSYLELCKAKELKIQNKAEDDFNKFFER